MRVRNILTSSNRFRPTYIPNLDGVGDVVPCQLQKSPFAPGLLGWRKLACAVIEDALRCAGLIDGQPVPNGGWSQMCGKRGERWWKNQRKQAISYLIGEEPDVAFPIDFACALAGVDVQALRERVIVLARQQLERRLEERARYLHLPLELARALVNRSTWEGPDLVRPR